MRAVVFGGAFDIQVEQIPDATILEPTDDVVQITNACFVEPTCGRTGARHPTNPAGKLAMNG